MRKKDSASRESHSSTFVHSGGHETNLDGLRVVHLVGEPLLTVLDLLFQSRIRVGGTRLGVAKEEAVGHDGVLGDVLEGRLGLVAQRAPEESLHLLHGGEVTTLDCLEVLFVRFLIRVVLLLLAASIKEVGSFDTRNDAAVLLTRGEFHSPLARGTSKFALIGIKTVGRAVVGETKHSRHDGGIL
ncbi:hypothetical protein HG531_001828 [Fusarium graminearum]|nr:hypothetical protein HG531_001828 [Fusarium graminearum]